MVAPGHAMPASSCFPIHFLAITRVGHSTSSARNARHAGTKNCRAAPQPRTARRPWAVVVFAYSRRLLRTAPLGTLCLMLASLALVCERAKAQGPGAPATPGAVTEAIPAEASSPAADSAGTEPSSAASRPRTGFLQIVFSGGPLGVAIMMVLIGLSITAVALAADNVRLLQRSQLIPPGLEQTVHEHLAAGDLAKAEAACRQSPSFLAVVLWHGLAESESGWSEVEKAMEDAAAEQAARLYRRVEYLSVIGNLAPMVGLLGTVTGMLLAFKEVADTEGNAGAAQLADGIYQALVTTVAGLIIAIPALGVFALLRSRLDQLVAEAAYAALHAMGPLKQREGLRRAPLAPPAPPRPQRGAG
jgi:biopolymer transport protein ExbB